MKSLIAGTVILAAALTGCTQGTPGGPGTTDANAKKSILGQVEDTFTLTVPVLSSSIQQGATTDATIGIKRAKNFDEDVTLKFDNVPEGVTLDPTSAVIKHGDEEAKITITATDDAAVGDYKINVVGHPTKGGDAKVEFKLTVAPIDTFTLSAPLLSTSVNQGESKEVSIGIKRDKTFDQDVTLNFGEMPEGVTIEPADPVIKAGETEAKVTITCAADASLGDFGIKVTGHPAEGRDAMTEIKVTVAKP